MLRIFRPGYFPGPSRFPSRAAFIREYLALVVFLLVWAVGLAGIAAMIIGAGYLHRFLVDLIMGWLNG